MNTLGDVVKTTQGLLGDPDGEWVTRDYILPFINNCYILEYLEIKTVTGRNLERCVEIENLDIGTTSLYPLQAAGKPLEGLTDPLYLWWKIAGQSPACYNPARIKETGLFVQGPGISVNSYSPGLFWTWMGNQLLVTPMASRIDILVDGRFQPTPLVKDSDVLIVSPDLEKVTSNHSAAVAGIERSNPTVLAGYAAAGDAGLNNITASLIMQKQAFRKRFARQARPRGWGWY